MTIWSRFIGWLRGDAPVWFQEFARRDRQFKEKLMASVADVNAALDQLSTSLSSQLTAIQTEIQQLIDAGSGATPEQLQGFVDRLAAMNTGVTDSIAQLAADDPPPPPAP